MMEALGMPFFQHAILAAIMASIACGIIGSLVVVNRIVFIAGGISHAAYGGVGLAFFLGLPVLPCTLGFTVGASALMASVSVRQPERADTMIGVLWAVGMAMGVILVDLTPGYNVDIMSFLFGSILTVPLGDLWYMAVTDIVVLATILALYRPFTAMSYDAEYARIRGVPVSLLYFVMLCLIAVTVVMVIRIVGLILVIALMTIPPFMVEKRSWSLSGMMVRATILSIIFSVAGLLLSYQFDLTSGPTIILVAATAFFADRIWGWAMRHVKAA